MCIFLKGKIDVLVVPGALVSRSWVDGAKEDEHLTEGLCNTCGKNREGGVPDCDRIFDKFINSSVVAKAQHQYMLSCKINVINLALSWIFGRNNFF